MEEESGKFNSNPADMSSREGNTDWSDILHAKHMHGGTSDNGEVGEARHDIDTATEIDYLGCEETVGMHGENWGRMMYYA